MFERFTDRARGAVVSAQREARDLGHNYIGTEHFLLGVLAVGDGIGAAVLRGLGVTKEDIRADVVAMVGEGRHEGASGAGPDAGALAALGLDLDEVRRRTKEAFGPGALERGRPGRRGWRARRRRDRCRPVSGHIPFTPRAKQAMEASLREALELRHNDIGTEHIVLGLLARHVRHGPAARMLDARGVTHAAVRTGILARLRDAS